MRQTTFLVAKIQNFNKTPAATFLYAISGLGGSQVFPNRPRVATVLASWPGTKGRDRDKEHSSDGLNRSTE